MDTPKAKAAVSRSDESLSLEDVSQNIPSTSPILRSLSKSCLRDPTHKHPPPPRAQVIDRAEDDISVQPTTQISDHNGDHSEEPTLLPREHTSSWSYSTIEQLPAEILDTIISFLGGQIGSAGNGNWSTNSRHPRRKDVSNLALVSGSWRRLVQERIFRHIKIHGTQPALSNSSDFFLAHSHLQEYVRHLQVIVPLWERTRGDSNQVQDSSDTAVDSIGSVVFRNIYGQSGTQGLVIDHQAEISQIFRPATQRATLSEIFATAQILFPALRALTIESAHCKHPPQIRYFRPQSRGLVPSQLSTSRLKITSPTGPDLPVLPSVKVVVLRGAWNIIRNSADLQLISEAMPNLSDITCSYHTPKTSPYITMCAVLRPGAIPTTVRHVNLCLEGLYAKIPNSLAKWKKVYPLHHICRTLGELLPQLESLTYTGRICGALFTSAVKATQRHHNDHIRTKRIDIIVKNVCREPSAMYDGTGFRNWPFIEAFEKLIVQSMRALAVYPHIEIMRIRFIDLDSPDGPLNPAFHMTRTEAWGFWSDQILELYYAARPMGKFFAPWESHESFQATDLAKRRSMGVTQYRAMLNSLSRLH